MIFCINQSTIMHSSTEEIIKIFARAGFNFMGLRQP